MRGMELGKSLYEGGPRLSQADPYAIEDNGAVYVYVTGSDGVHMYKSRDLEAWEYAGVVLRERGSKEYWAPSVIKLNGVFYMYYSAMPEYSADVHEQAIRVAVAERAEGPFEFRSELLPPFSIDAHVIRNESGLYMFYSVNDYEAKKAGTYIVVDKMKDPFTMYGKPVSAVRPTLKEEMYQSDRFRRGQDWYTIEGAFYLEDSGVHYLMYSGSSWEKESYFVGYGVARGGCADLRELKFAKVPDENTYAPLLKRNDRVEGTGHNSVLKHNGRYYIFYHGRDICGKEAGALPRTFRANRINVADGKITLCEPL